jgi:hypothetical protein
LDVSVGAVAWDDEDMMIGDAGGRGIVDCNDKAQQEWGEDRAQQQLRKASNQIRFVYQAMSMTVITCAMTSMETRGGVLVESDTQRYENSDKGMHHDSRYAYKV